MAQEATAPVTFDELLSRSDLKQEEVGPVPRWGITVTIRELSAAEMAEVTKDRIGPDGRALDVLAVNKDMLRLALVTPRLTAEQIDAMYNRSSEPIVYIVQQVSRLNNFGQEGQVAAGESFPAA